jgi:TP901 family phage tail tape measure protein
VGIEAAKLFVSVEGDTASAEAGMLAVEQKFNALGKKLTQVGTQLSLALTLPMVAVGKKMLDVGVDFDRAMGVLRVASNASSTELQKMGDYARELGADLSLPGTSASDAAQAMMELSKAGLDVNNIMGASRGVLQLAAAGQISNARAAEIASNALNAFSLSGEEATRIADLLAAGANASSAEVEDMADSLQMSAAVFSAAGVPIEDLTTMIGEMANQGIKGSDAGTSLKQMLLSLQAPSDKAASLMEELGIKIYDTQGNMLDMRDIIQNFSESLSGLTEEQRNQALATIFGSDAVRAANVVLMKGVDLFDDMKTSVTESGAASELAGGQMEGLAGALETLKSAAETALLAGMEPLREETEDFLISIADVLTQFSELDEETRKTIVNVGLLAAGLGPTLFVMGKLAILAGSVASGLGALASGAIATFGAWQAGLTATTALSVGFGALAVSVGSVAAALASLVGVYLAAKNAADQAEEGAENARAGWQGFIQAQVSGGLTAVQITDAYIQKAAQLNGILDEQNFIIQAIVRAQQGSVTSTSQLSEALANTTGSYEEYTSLMLKANVATGDMTEESAKLYIGFLETGRATEEMMHQIGLLTDAEYANIQAFNEWVKNAPVLYTAHTQMEYRAEMLAGELTDEQKAALAAAKGITTLANAFGDAEDALMTTSDVISTISSGLQSVGVDSVTADWMLRDLSVTLGATSAEELRMQDSLTLLGQAFGFGIISGNQFNGLVNDMNSNMGQLDGLTRGALERQVEWAETAKTAQKAAEDYALAQLSLAESLKGATGAQAAQALEGELAKQLQSGAIDLPTYIAAISGIQETFGLADDKSRALADGILILTANLTNGTLPAENMGKALQAVYTDSVDGVVNMTAIMDQFGRAPEAIGTAADEAERFSDSMLVRMKAAGEEMPGIAADISLAFTGADWDATGLAVGTGIAAGITASTPLIEAAARAAALAALAAANEALGVESPSKEFMETGRQIMAGLAQGITQTATEPQRAMTDSLPTITNTPTNYYSETYAVNLGSGAIVINEAGDGQAAADDFANNLEDALRAARSRGMR